MSGFFAAALKKDCTFDLFFGTDYHSHLGTRRAGLAVYDEIDGFNRTIHNIENSPFRTKFDHDIHEMQGHLGLGIISDYDPQPLLIRSQHGTYAIATVGKINNRKELSDEILQHGAHFLEMRRGLVNSTELTAALINQKDNLIEGIRYAQERIDGSITILLMTPAGIYCARDKVGRTPLVIGRKGDEGFCASFEAFAYLNLGYTDYKELGPGEIAVMTPDGITTLVGPGNELKICAFLWVYYGYPSSQYEGVSVEKMRYNCGALMAKRDSMGKDEIDTSAGVPDSGTAAAIGYANEAGVPFTRPFIKYTPTWPRSFMPTMQSQRNLIAKMKLIPAHDLIEGKKLLLVDDSIVRGTQLRETTEFLYKSGAKEVHVRPACPPILYGCKFINFSRSTGDMELIARRVIARLEGTEDVSKETLEKYSDPETKEYENMLEGIRQEMGFTTLKFCRLDDMIEAIGIGADRICTYCWNGKE